MKKIALKLEITNNKNDDRFIEWFFFDTYDEKLKFIEDKKQEENKWNYHTVGVVSTRYYNFSEYLISNLLETDISNLEGMKLKDFIEVIKNCL